MCLRISKIPSIFFILLCCTNRCLILKLLSRPFNEVSALLLSQSIYRFGKFQKLTNTVAFFSPKCSQVVYLAYLWFFIGIASQGFASIYYLAGWCFVIKKLIVCSISYIYNFIFKNCSISRWRIFSLSLSLLLLLQSFLFLLSCFPFIFSMLKGSQLYALGDRHLVDSFEFQVRVDSVE